MSPGVYFSCYWTSYRDQQNVVLIHRWYFYTSYLLYILFSNALLQKRSVTKTDYIEQIPWSKYIDSHTEIALILRILNIAAADDNNM